MRHVGVVERESPAVANARTLDVARFKSPSGGRPKNPVRLYGSGRCGSRLVALNTMYEHGHLVSSVAGLVKDRKETRNVTCPDGPRTTDRSNGADRASKHISTRRLPSKPKGYKAR